MIAAKRVGERGRNRTFNLLIKSQLLCQLSYAPTAWDWREVRTKIIASDFAEVGAHIVNEFAQKSDSHSEQATRMDSVPLATGAVTGDC